MRQSKRENHLGSERSINPGESPREHPDRINNIERTIASMRPDSTSASWNISRRSSSVRDLTRHRATARPGRLAGINCVEFVNNRIVNEIITRVDTHVTRGGPMHPSVLYVTVCEHASPRRITFRFNSERH